MIFDLFPDTMWAKMRRDTAVYFGFIAVIALPVWQAQIAWLINAWQIAFWVPFILLLLAIAGDSAIGITIAIATFRRRHVRHRQLSYVSAALSVLVLLPIGGEQETIKLTLAYLAIVSAGNALVWLTDYLPLRASGGQYPCRIER